MLKRSAVVPAKREGGNDQRWLDDQVARKAVVAGCTSLGNGFFMVRGRFLAMASIMFRGGYLHGAFIVLVQAKWHGLYGVALHGQPHEHESKQQSGEENFHESG